MRPHRGVRRLAPYRSAVAAAVAALAVACQTAHPLLKAGDATYAEIDYVGDIGPATALARAHCARYERVARLIDQEPEFARYQCVKR
ncbi:MAG TPA: hypothetical protein VFA12_07605 [Stellaceae bacterium]|nr:hypothetical protein [Stellaceae bacterium]